MIEIVDNLAHRGFICECHFHPNPALNEPVTNLHIFQVFVGHTGYRYQTRSTTFFWTPTQITYSRVKK